MISLPQWLKKLWRRTITPLLMKYTIPRYLWLRLRGSVKVLDTQGIRFTVTRAGTGPRGHFVFTPSDFPKGIRYQVLAQGSYFSEVLPYLQVVVPDSEFCGFVGESELVSAREPYLLIVSEDWPRLLYNTNFGLPRENVLVLIPFVGDMWGYWDATSRIMTHATRNTDGSWEIPADIMWDSLPNGQRGGTLGNKMIVWKRNYLKYYPELVDAHSHLIRKVASGLSDRRSRDLYNFLFSAEPEAMIQQYWSTLFSKVQYCEYVHIEPGDHVIDGGIHTGVELPFFLAMLERRGKLWCIDPMGFDFLHPTVKTTVDFFAAQIRMIPVALWNEDGMIKVPISEDGQALGMLAGSDHSGGSSHEFPCLRLDALVSDYGVERVNLIKLDLEGSEPQALMGMEKTIEKFRPSMAVSIYHEPRHMWEIPLYLMERLDAYDYYIGHYSLQKSECILYCIPRKR
jgi:FkbM family methyltransferase